MTFKHFLILFLALGIVSCKKEIHLNKIEGKRIEINDSLSSDVDIEAYIKPYREHVNNDLDSIIAYALDTYSKRDGELNTAIGNLMADIVYEQGNAVFNKRTGKDIDFVLLNHGGIRSIISKGQITSRTAYEVMPFDNAIVVVDLKGEQVKELLDYLAEAKRAHPISKLELILDNDYNIISSKVKDNAIDFTKNYYVATNDYLYNGGDRMNFFKTNDSLYVLDYKVRNALIDYFKKVDTLNPKIDNRFIKQAN
ncbi:5'-nucleotidase [Ichthyenterobacterium sp. W332]|uniref:5'-nucleotidase n=1 Tax=Microcosmobacter mediterraneus TaxID=3075607 RepID=A0ABU2YKI3_9FLAO|nr:5'-nucleotidase [Ichthyenterobacterium sp. W332]MDT0557533.1 5'-nucleotidase [Ichthyenterobacterium sp. W332]